ncbi:hypothetical protein [Streptomyces sp. NPDC058861]|uniref:hypothetical protein n=1 Tax=Streptomyces sp. NPDC058861 TaxID=3346653 RepID=UPI0036B3E83F
MKRDSGYRVNIDFLTEIERKYPQLPDLKSESGDALALVVEVQQRRGFPLRRIAKDIAKRAGGVTTAVVVAPLRSGREIAVLTTAQLLELAEEYSDMKDMLRVERSVRAAAGR